MKPIDFRNETFRQLQERIVDYRRDVLNAWLDYETVHGRAGATTVQVAMWSGMSLLSLRPRTTELYQLGAIRLAEKQPDGSEGRYVSRTEEEWREWYLSSGGQRRQGGAKPAQGELTF